MKPYYDDGQAVFYQGDVRAVLREMEPESVQVCVTSPPYWGLRCYGVDGQLGLEATPEEYVAAMVEVFREVRRVLRKDGSLWLNLGDCYAGGGTIGRNDTTPERLAQRAALYGTGTGNGSVVGYLGTRPPVAGLKPKDLVGIPWMVAFALRADGWWLRSDIIWAKPNPMPESVTDRPTKAHEYLFLLTKSERYYYDADAVREDGEGYGRSERLRGANWVENHAFDNSQERVREGGGRNSFDGSGRNKRSVWTIPTAPFPEAHFATFPPALVKPCVLAGSREGDVVLDPFLGSGTTAMVAKQLGRRAVGIDLSAEYLEMATRRCGQLAFEASL